MNKRKQKIANMAINFVLFAVVVECRDGSLCAGRPPGAFHDEGVFRVEVCRQDTADDHEQRLNAPKERNLPHGEKFERLRKPR